MLMEQKPSPNIRLKNLIKFWVVILLANIWVKLMDEARWNCFVDAASGRNEKLL